MRTLTFVYAIIAVLFSQTANAQAQDMVSINSSKSQLEEDAGQWRWEKVDNPGAFSYRYNSYMASMRDVDFADERNGIAVGDFGLMAFTTDGGQSWNEYKRWGTPRVELNEMAFFNESTGAIPGNGMLLWTDNGGKTWEEKINPAGGELSDIAFASAKKAVAVGSSGIIRTKDGGKNWNSIQVDRTVELRGNEREVELTSVTFMDANVGIAVGFIGTAGQTGTILRTQDGGKTWNKVDAPGGMFTSVQSPGKQSFMILDGYGNILKSTDQGKSWDQIELPKESYKKLYFPTAQTGYLLGRNNLYKSTNGGNDWSKIGEIPEAGLSDLAFQSGKLIMASSSSRSKVFSTSDEGANWEEVTTLQNSLTSIHFINAQQGYMTAKSGVVYQTTDGGESWEIIAEPYGRISNVEFLTSEKVFAVSSDIHYSSDRGDTWETVETSTESSITAISFATEQIGLATLQNGHILRTTDAGQTWDDKGLAAPIDAHSSTRKASLNDITFLDNQIGMAVGDEYLVRTTTAGQSGSQQDNPAADVTLHAVSFADDKTGIAVGDDATIIRSNDKGKTWKKMNTPIESSYKNKLYDVDFLNSKKGVAVGLGQIIFTHDGGKSWQHPEGDYPDDVWRAVSFLDQETVIMVGSKGEIVRGKLE
ncbi:MAG: WD40/YVTN/BNR-like repeat-containing protein [Bacteroidota bacterium]